MAGQYCTTDPSFSPAGTLAEVTSPFNGAGTYVRVESDVLYVIHPVNGLQTWDISTNTPSLLDELSLDDLGFPGSQNLYADFDFSGDRAFIINPTGKLVIVDISNTSSLSVDSSTTGLAANNDAQHLYYPGSGNYIFIADDAHVRVIDVSGTPSVSTSMDMESVTSSTWSSGVAKIQIGTSGCLVAQGSTSKWAYVDASTPTSLSYESQSTGSMYGMTVDGDVMYRGDGSNIRTYDISDPSSVSLTDTVELETSQSLEDLGDLVKVGNYIYGIATNGNEGLFSVDVTDPADISYGDQLTLSLAAFGLVNQTPMVGASSDRLFVLLPSAELDIVDITDPTDLSIEATVDYGLGAHFTGIRDILSNADGIVVTVNDGFLTAVDASDPAAMTVEGVLENSAFDVSSLGHSSVMVGDYVYTINYGTSSFYVTDVSDPTDPTITDSIVADSTNLGGGIVCWKLGTNVFVASIGTLSNDGFLTTIDVSDPADISVTNKWSNSAVGFASAITGQGDYIYVLNYSSGQMSVIDVSTPTSPSSTGSVTDATDSADFIGVGAVRPDGDAVFFGPGNSTKNVVAFDVSTKSSPSKDDTYTVTGTPSGTVFIQLEIGGDYLYAPFWYTTYALDVSDSSSITLADSYNPGYNTQVTVFDDVVVIDYSLTSSIVSLDQDCTLGGGVTNIEVNVPVDTFTLTAYAPTLQVDQLLGVPLQEFTLTTYEPLVATDDRIYPPSVEFTFTTYAPQVIIDAATIVPLVEFTATFLSPRVQLSVDIPLFEFTFTTIAPTYYIDAVARVPRTEIELSFPLPQAVIDGYAGNNPTAGTGFYVDAAPSASDFYTDAGPTADTTYSDKSPDADLGET